MENRKPLRAGLPDAPDVNLEALVEGITRENRHEEVDTAPSSVPLSSSRKKRKSGIPTGNAGEYFVMGELLRREFDAQLADRNTRGYDLIVAKSNSGELHRVQVKTVRSAPWYIKLVDFQGEFLNRITIYVLLGPPKGDKPVRYFVARNGELAKSVHRPKSFSENGFMPLKAVMAHENRWDLLRV